MDRSDEGATPAPAPSSPITFAWPTVGPDAVAAAPAPPTRRRVRPVVAVVGAASLVLALGGAALALGSRDDKPSTAAPTATTSPTAASTPSPTPTDPTAGALAGLRGAVDALTAEMATATALWTSTDGLVADPATRDALRVVLDTAQSWLDDLPDPGTAADVQRLTGEARAHVSALQLRSQAVQQSHEQHVGAAAAPTPAPPAPRPQTPRNPGSGSGSPATGGGSSSPSVPQVPVVPSDPGTGGTQPDPTTPPPPQPTPDPPPPSSPPPTDPGTGGGDMGAGGGSP